MAIIVGEPAIIRMNPPQEDHLTLDRHRQPRNRRKDRRDRRRSVRDGVYVTLSTKAERRQGSDRRQGDT